MATFIEAETIISSNVINYRIENRTVASGGSLLSFLGGAANEQGSVTLTFDEPLGRYDIVIGSFDENDGDPAARFSIIQNGRNIGSLVLDQEPGGAGVSPNTRVELTLEDIVLATGDSLRIEGIESGDEHARLDFIRFDLVNESPTITSPNAVQIPENQTFVLNIEGTDRESSSLTYTVTGGADQEAFTINQTTGELSFVTAPDFENPRDIGSDNIYGVEVTVTDSEGLSAQQLVSVSVTDVADSSTGDNTDTNVNGNSDSNTSNDSGGNSSNPVASPNPSNGTGELDDAEEGVVDEVFEQLPVVIRATPNPDKLRGNGLDNKMRGLAEDDLLRGKAGDDFISGNSGNDSIFGNRGNDTVRGRTGDDDINGGGGDDRLIGDRGEDTIDGSGGNDFLKGGAGRDELQGGKGKDELIGNGKQDILNGGAGNDTIVGGFHDDTITTGSGRDVVVYNHVKDGTDTITDFSVGRDRLDLSGMVESYNLNASTVWERNITLSQQGGTTVVQFDRDGNGSKNPIDLVNLEGVSADAINSNTFIF